jgi:SAM-dependent methyltransferase
MGDSRDFDLDQMMEQIRLNLHNRRAAADTPAPDLSKGQAEEDWEAVEHDLAALHSGYDISSVDLNPNRRVFGRVMLASARFVAELLRPLIRRQAEYNAANTRLTDRLKREVQTLRPRYLELRTMTERTLARNLEDFKAQSEAAARRYAKLHADDIAMHAEALSGLGQRIQMLEQRHADLERDAARTEAMEIWHAELQRQSHQVELLEHQQAESRAKLDSIDMESHAETVRGLTERVEILARQHESIAQQEQLLVEQGQRLEALDARSSQLGEQLAGRIEAVGEAQTRSESLARSRYQEFQTVRERIWRTERRLRRMLAVENGATPEVLAQAAPEAPPDAAEMDYAGFEERVRDSERVKARQRGYLEYFAGKGPVIDVGCGRGEFLELMREAGIDAMGLDQDLDMALLCKDKGLDVVQCDAIGYLAGRPDTSLGGIFSAQVIEHMTPAQLSALVTLASRKLVRGGTLVLETLNPESLFVHYKWFWMDPSHVRLVHPQTLTFLLESAGFGEVSCHFTSPPEGILPIPPLQSDGQGSVEEFNRATDYLNKLIFADQEYFVVGKK